MKHLKGTMPDEVVTAIVENVKKYQIPGVRLIRWGEPTLHPKYIDIIRQLKYVGAIVHINTNGSLLNKEQIKRLVDVELDSLKFSFQGADEGTYNEMREGGDYKHLLEKVESLYQTRGEKVKPYIQISTTLTGESVEQIENFKKDVEVKCDYYNVRYTQLTHINGDNMKIDEEEKIRNLQAQEN